MDDGTRLVALVDPLAGARASGAAPGPGAVILAAAAPPLPDRERIRLTVRNDSTRAVRISSHYPFERV